MVDSETAVDNLTEGHDGSNVAECLTHRVSGETDGEGVAFCCEGELGDSDCESAGARERDTWEDWCDSAFCSGYGDFPPDVDDPQPPVVFSNQLFWNDNIAEASRMMPDGEIMLVSTSLVHAGAFVPLMLPDVDRTVWLHDSRLELLHNRIGECSVLPRGTGDTLSDMETPEGDAMRACSRDVGILAGIKGWLCLLYSDSSRNPWRQFRRNGIGL